MVLTGGCGRLRSGDLGWGWTMVKFVVLTVMFEGRVLGSGESLEARLGFISVSMYCE